MLEVEYDFHYRGPSILDVPELSLQDILRHYYFQFKDDNSAQVLDICVCSYVGQMH